MSCVNQLCEVKTAGDALAFLHNHVTFHFAGISIGLTVQTFNRFRHHSICSSAKGEAVVNHITVTDSTNLLVIAADSMLEVDGVSYGKPGTPDVARARWKLLRGSMGYLHSGHWVKDLVTGEIRTGTAGAVVEFGDVSDAEIDDYVASGEPLGVAGGFTHEGRSSAFITRIDGDVPAVAGMSMLLLRTLTADMGISWTSLWQ